MKRTKDGRGEDEGELPDSPTREASVRFRRRFAPHRGAVDDSLQAALVEGLADAVYQARGRLVRAVNLTGTQARPGRQQAIKSGQTTTTMGVISGRDFAGSGPESMQTCPGPQQVIKVGQTTITINVGGEGGGWEGTGYGFRCATNTVQAGNGPLLQQLHAGGRVAATESSEDVEPRAPPTLKTWLGKRRQTQTRRGVGDTGRHRTQADRARQITKQRKISPAMQRCLLTTLVPGLKAHTCP